MDKPPALESVQKMKSLEAELNERFRGRREVVRSLILGVLAREHVLLLSGTGEQKSALINKLLSGLGGKKFTRQMSIDTRRRNLLGPLKTSGIPNDEYTRVGENFIQSAEWAFLDEIGDAPDEILRMLLKIMNERAFDEEDGRQEKIPLMSLFAAANYMSGNQRAEAVMDRFLLSPILNGDPSLVSILGESLDARDGLFKHKIETKMSLDEVRSAQEASEKTTLPAHVEFEKAIILSRFIRELRRHEPFKSRSDIKPYSRRRTIEVDGILKAHAALEGRTEIGPEDLKILEWTVSNAIRSKHVSARRDMKSVIDSTRGMFTANRTFAAQSRLVGALADGHHSTQGFEKSLTESGAIRERGVIQSFIAKFTSPATQELRDLVVNMTPDNQLIEAFRDETLRRTA